MKSISNSLIGNSYNQYDYSYMSGESIPISKTPNEKEMEVNKGIKFKEVKFEKKSNDIFIVYVLTQNKEKFISNEITFSKFKKRNNIKYEDIDTFIREVNNINKNEKNIDYEFSVYLENETIRIKYRYLKKNNNNVAIVFIAKDTLNNLKEEINKLSNLYLNLEENYKKREKILKLN